MIDSELTHPLENGKFYFACHRDLPCFTKCCANLNLLLMPYDVLRLKNKLQLSSDAFLEKYTTCHVDDHYGVPVVKLLMNEDANRRCPFVGPEGCTVYEDRPGACRLYPLGRAASKIYDGQKAGEYYFVIKESHCIGFNEKREWSVDEWLMDQGLKDYNAMNDLFIDVTAGRPAKAIKKLSEQQLQMYYMASYSLDDFRQFVFTTTFLDRFDVSPEVLNRIKGNETELLTFANQWLKFSLFGEKTFHMAVNQ